MRVHGVRALAFANGGLLPDKIRGTNSEGVIHIADWNTTFCKLAGVDPSDSGPGKFPVDGLDVWPIITGENTTTPHEEIMLGYNFSAAETSAIIMGDYKLIINQKVSGCDSVMWTPLDYPCHDGSKGESCDPYCLYNIVEDANKHIELSQKEPDILKKLLSHYNEYGKELRDMQDQGYHISSDLPLFNDACNYMKENRGFWQPWQKQG